jgi:hypothetical protein
MYPKRRKPKQKDKTENYNQIIMDSIEWNKVASFLIEN